VVTAEVLAAQGGRVAAMAGGDLVEALLGGGLGDGLGDDLRDGVGHEW